MKQYLLKMLVFMVVLGRALTLLAAPGVTGKKDPHKEEIVSFQKNCQTCHPSDPLKADNGAHPIDFEKCLAQCRGCHTIPQRCILISTEKSTLILKSQMHYLGLPLLPRGIYCGSCHLFHDRGGASEHKLNSFYPNFWYRAQQVDPHRSGVFCQLCHDPASSTEHLKFKGDQACLKCHDGKKARADNHPVHISPSKEKGVHIPDGFPLSDGKLTCITCHLMPCQGGKIKGNLLRGGPYQKRVDMCLSCHMKERYQAVNPHIQVDKNGRILKNKCLYCHII